MCLDGNAGSSPRLRGTRSAIARAAQWPVDHPRACGEHFGQNTAGWARAGSSPRLRGTLLGHGEACEGRGIIPALAGNTAPSCIAARSNWDHPRACGEHRLNVAGAAVAMGSSPRLRGTRDGGRVEEHGCGIIPALAGNTSRRTLSRIARWDHPRACGEHAPGMASANWFQGSSPRLRGTRPEGVRPRRHGGIIPALAGNTSAHYSHVAPPRDHPRACGEHSLVASANEARAGSSPRLRGTPHPAAPQGHGLGIIPALAGNTRRSCRGRPVPWDHPRACGEHGHRVRRRAGPRGIIPALAGNTFNGRTYWAIHRDHPRACGEHKLVSMLLAMSVGSSPRLRGTLITAVMVELAFGIIPALAGNT